ncbi:uncharacterized protein LOC133886105 [Phragmites australis]|uniref:uncharacterized protein LOC133886105 n=1 Tax=Phragmites australis TaxID=29695 RepID=UPI002D79E854|nr:uncharacterized protein LOC133886105 [Phragmites australis]
MTCGACGRAYNGGGEASREELVAPLLDLGKGRPWGRTAETPAEKDPIMKKAVERAVKFLLRGLLILLWMYLFNSMRRYAINYIGGDTWFSTFAVIAVAIPIAEIFCIFGQTLTTAPWLVIESPMPCSASGRACIAGADGEGPREELDALFLDLEKGGRGYTRAPLLADVMTEIATMTDLTDAQEAAVDMALSRIIKCSIRGLLVLLWVYLINLMRRYVTTHSAEELIFTICPLGVLGLGVSVFFCFLMESFSECIYIPPST